jgi:4-amino-4-deoxy-L-arabinose transferase-like glycosyltransferase
MSAQDAAARRGNAPKIIAALFIASWFAILGVRPLFNPDEGRYAEIPREMLASGDWLVPHLNNLVYIEKPPLQYWATALSYEVFGIHVWAARFYTGLCALLTVLVVAALARRLWGARVAWRAGIMLGSMLGMIVIGQQLTLDTSLTFFLTLTLAAFCMAQDPATLDGRRRYWMTLAWASAAAAFLTKGLIALVLPSLTLVAYSLLHRRFKPWSRLSLLPGCALFVLISAPWCVLMQRQVPQFFDFFFIREHFQRFLTRIEDRYEPVWFFIPVLAIGCLPWILPATRALGSTWRRANTAADFEPRAFLWVWVVVVFVFFSMSDSKLIPYILPVVPALALLMASAPEEALRRDLVRTSAGVIAAGILLMAAAAILPEFLRDPARAPYFAGLRLPIFGMGLIAAGGGWIARGSKEPVAALGITAYVCFAILVVGAGSVAPLYSGAALAAQISPAIMPNTKLYAVRTYDQTLPFYLGHTMTLVEERNELDFGLGLEPQKGIATLDAFSTRWLAEPAALAVMEPDTYALLRGQGLPMMIRASSPSRLIVSPR